MPQVSRELVSDKPGKRMRWAIVGLGTFGVGQVIPGFAHARQSRITTFVSGNAETAGSLGQEYGVDHLYLYENFDDISDNPDVDCALTVLPVGLHAEYTIRALDAGKHVLCEKRMASTSIEAAAMIEAAKRNNRELGVAYRVNFEPNNSVFCEPDRKGRNRQYRDLASLQLFRAFPKPA